MKIRFMIILAALFTVNVSLAKKVKFSCDMTGIAIAPTGMHVSGDFQTAAGFAGGDWNSASTPLTQEPGTDIYSIIVDIPAFAKYEYKFVNGDQFYEAEFVPEYSRVGYNFNDNRWLYVDSIANDTTFTGAIMFAANAPMGMKLARFYVDMTGLTVSSSGVHVAGVWQNWDPATTILYSFGNNIYEMICYMPVNTYQYKFYNGNNTASSETVPSACAFNGNRQITITDDVLVPLVCYSSCDPCLTGISELASAEFSIAPNPANQNVYIHLNTQYNQYNVILLNLNGKEIRRFNDVNSGIPFMIARENLASGIYIIKVESMMTAPSYERLIFN